MSYEIIPQEIRDLINTDYRQINDEHKKQLVALWRIMFQIGGDNEQTEYQFRAFLQQEIANTVDPQIISDSLGDEIAHFQQFIGGKKKRRRVTKKRKGKSSKKSKKSRKNKKSYKKRK